MDNRSEPVERHIATKMAKPRLASHAPSVRRMSRKNGLVCGYREYMSTISIVRVKTITSMTSRIISRWVRWDKNTKNGGVRAIVRERVRGKAIADG